jgi:uncharacterized protein (TIGR02246 family)
MSSQSRNVVITVLTALVFVGCQAQAPAGLSDTDRNTLRQKGDEFAKAANTKDFASAAGNYADDAGLMPPNGQVVTGRDAIQKWMTAFPPMSDFRVEVVDVDGRGDLAYVRGNYSLTIQAPGAPPTPDHGKYLEIWRKQSDGSWKIKWDIFNSDVPAPQPPPPAETEG